MFGVWVVIWALIISLAMLVPLAFCILYIAISLRQWSIGEKENSAEKKAGAIKALAISFAGLLLVITAWWLVITNL